MPRIKRDDLPESLRRQLDTMPSFDDWFSGGVVSREPRSVDGGKEVIVPTSTRCVTASPGKMNGAESDYAAALEERVRSGEITFYGFERMTLRVGDDCRYTPDFLVRASSGQIELHEVKVEWRPSKKRLATDPSAKPRVGWREDARVKFLACAAAYPFFRFFVAVQRRDKSFDLSLAYP